MALDLLDLLDACIKADQGPSGLRGEISVGIGEGPAERWLRVQLDGVARSELSSEASPDATAVLQLGERSAHSIMSNGTLADDDDEIWLAGDAELLRRFVARYVEQKSWLAARAHSPNKPRR